MAENNNSIPLVETFRTFLGSWMIKQEEYLQELLHFITKSEEEEEDEENKNIIELVMAHYLEYLQTKTTISEQNVFLMFSPPWFSSFERSHIWIAGFKPALALRVVISSVTNLGEEQSRKLSRLIMEIKTKEKVLADRHARIQESMAGPTILELARHVGQVARNGTVGRIEREVEILRSSLKDLMECADHLRVTTIMKIVDILSPPQLLRFLAAAAHLQLRIHRWGRLRGSYPAQ
ncbi:hypothetical protein Leryth_015595 [Lithospermum erythrorhizon]|nr:hypothetical protein Leryth_015595 [Lithospermum erythrorhizon]